MLLRTTRMRAMHIDPAARIARAGAGAVWPDVTVPATQHDLAALAGSSATVGVSGYTLGGGLGWLARRHVSRRPSLCHACQGRPAAGPGTRKNTRHSYSVRAGG